MKFTKNLVLGYMRIVIKRDFKYNFKNRIFLSKKKWIFIPPITAKR